MAFIHIIHENYQWFEPLRSLLTERNVPFTDCFMGQGILDPMAAPMEGVYLNKMSASSYTRDHRYAPEYTFALLAHLESHGRRVINGSNALRLEMSKIEQAIALKRVGIAAPRTIAAFGHTEILAAAESISGPCILKPNRGGKGIGVQLFHSRQMLAEFLNAHDLAASCDGITLVQEYVEAPDPTITRLEFIGSRFVYAVAVDTSQGFELCPAEACRINVPAQAAEVCALNTGEGLFNIITDFQDPLIPQLEAFLREQRIDIAGIEYIRDHAGRAYVYDMNMNTNYNPEAEKKAGISAMQKLLDFLEAEAAR